MSERSESDIRRLEALQTKNPGWTVQLDGRGRTVAIKRWASLMREDIRSELEPFVLRNASELGADGSMTRVIDEPTHVRYESRAAKQAIDARLRDGALVVHVE